MIKSKEQRFSKNVTLKGSVIELIMGYMNKTKTNFSSTLNIIVEEWDKVSLELQRLAYEELEKKTEKDMKNIKEGKVEKK